MATKPETRLVKRIRKRLQAEWPKSRWFKQHGGLYSESGVSDLIGCVEGMYCALEAKTAKGEASELQKEFIKDILRAGGCAGVVRTPEEAVALVRSARAKAARRRQRSTSSVWICPIL